DPSIDGFRVQIDVVYPHDFAAMNIDDLLVQEIAFEEKEVIESRRLGPFGSWRGGAHLGVDTDLNHAGNQETITSGGLDYQPGNPGWIFLGTQSHFSHFACDRSA